jgi:hypothetical protein
MFCHGVLCSEALAAVLTLIRPFSLRQVQIHVIGQTIFGAELLVAAWAEEGVHICFGGVLLQVVLPNRLVREYLPALETSGDISDNSVYDKCNVKLLSSEGKHIKWSRM